jgi:hypothetical protein
MSSGYAVHHLQLSQKVILVGGLAGSPYVYKDLQEWGAQMGISVSRPDGPTWVFSMLKHTSVTHRLH